jgi:4-hydroxythreonine-4-phosphate dehydrogenase
MKKVAITTGDIDGIGTEVSAKALEHLGPSSKYRFFIWRSSATPKADLKRIDKKFQRITVNSFSEALAAKTKGSRVIMDICSELAPAHWVSETAKACMKGDLDALVTGPLSKTGIREAGYSRIGHTEILADVAQVDSLYMGFVGPKFNVVLATGHIPIEKVSQNLRVEKIVEAVQTADQLRLKLPLALQKKPMALVGLNPHAGEHGIIGQEEELVFQKALVRLNTKFKVVGPLVPDAAFFPDNWKKYSVFIASYHDQGLIPFKLVHGQNAGAHITLGLPFIRTSVDHGCAKDIFGRNQANARSMIDAIEWALKLSRGGK